MLTSPGNNVASRREAKTDKKTVQIHKIMDPHCALRFRMGVCYISNEGRQFNKATCSSPSKGLQSFHAGKVLEVRRLIPLVISKDSGELGK